MDHIPLGAILLLLVVDLLVVELMSVASGVIVARGAGAPLGKGALIGLLPVVGPLVWGISVLSRDPSNAGVLRVRQRGPVLYAATGGLLVAALLFLVGMAAPWVDVSGSHDRLALATKASAADTGVGLAASLLSAVVLVASVAIVLLWSPWRRTSFLLTALGSVWLLIAVDVLILVNALEEIISTVDGASASRSIAEASPGLGLWLALVAAIFVLAGALTLGFLPRGHDVPLRVALLGAAAPPAASHLPDWGAFPDPSAGPPRPAPSAPGAGADYGEGY